MSNNSRPKISIKYDVIKSTTTLNKFQRKQNVKNINSIYIGLLIGFQPATFRLNLQLKPLEAVNSNYPLCKAYVCEVSCSCFVCMTVRSRCRLFGEVVKIHRQRSCKITCRVNLDVTFQRFQSSDKFHL